MHKPFSISRLFARFTAVLAGIFLLFLTAASAISTCTMRGDYLEKTFFVSSPVLPKIILLCLCALILRIPAVRKFLGSAPEQSRLIRRRRILTLTLFLFSACWVLITQPTVISDQEDIQVAAEQLNYGDLSCLRQGGYLARYPNQTGAILVSALIQRLIGRDNYLVFQLINALLAALSYFILMRLCEEEGLSIKNPSLLFGAALLFFPFLLYATFVYATIPSFFLALLAYRRIRAYETSPSFLRALSAGLLMALAVFLKQNSLIFLIAAVLYSLFSAFRSGLSRLTLTASLILFTALALFLPRALLERATGLSIPDGISPYSYLAMGLKDGGAAPGWYNSYINAVYGEGDVDAAQQKTIALQVIRERLGEFQRNPLDAVRFYVQKNASQWNNPTFESLWITQVRGSNIRPADWVRRLIRPTGVDFLTKLLNPIQFLLLFWAFLSLFQSPPDPKTPAFLLLVTFVGGFLFHTFWEAKCQYTFPYFVLLLPFSISGLRTLSDFVTEPRTFLCSLSAGRRVLLLLSLILLLFLSVLLAMSGFLTCDNAAYSDYLRQLRISG